MVGRLTQYAGIPGFWYTKEQFDELARVLREEMDTVGNTWRFYVATARRPLQG